MFINRKKDGHVHSPYCPHGSKDTIEEYIENAIKSGLEEITFTEHIVIPEDFMDNEFLKECSPNSKQLEKYFEEIAKYKKLYKDKIKVNVGIEVDYIEGYEYFTKENLDKYGHLLDDSILSVHFGKYGNKYYIFDYMKGFEELINDIGSVEKVYDLYYNTLLKAVKSDLGEFKPKRIGHPTLIRIFNKKYPIEYKNKELFEEIISLIKSKGYELDYNVAGLRKEFCKEVYPSGDFYKMAVENNIKMVYGSDSHVAKFVGYNLDYIQS